MVKVGIIMGSKSDLETMKEAAQILESFKVPYEVKVLRKEALKLLLPVQGEPLICQAWKPAMTTLPVIGGAKALRGLDSLLSIAQMPGGVPVAIGKAGAKC